jgi:hypothetical protein
MSIVSLGHTAHPQLCSSLIGTPAARHSILRGSWHAALILLHSTLPRSPDETNVQYIIFILRLPILRTKYGMTKLAKHPHTAPKNDTTKFGSAVWRLVVKI